MSSGHRSIREERLSEFVTQLSGAPLDHARGAVANAMERNMNAGDSLWDVADALVSIRANAA